jgi:hypothetical protein
MGKGQGEIERRVAGLFAATRDRASLTRKSPATPSPSTDAQLPAPSACRPPAPPTASSAGSWALSIAPKPVIRQWVGELLISTPTRKKGDSASRLHGYDRTSFEPP